MREYNLYLPPIVPVILLNFQAAHGQLVMIHDYFARPNKHGYACVRIQTIFGVRKTNNDVFARFNIFSFTYSEL